jgi:rhodanese-related sulfurtransferase
MTATPGPRFRRITPAEAADLVVRHRRGVLHELALYDVRDRRSFDQGHVEGARWLDGEGVARELLTVPKRTPVVVYCYHGNASQSYAATFADFRFVEVYSVDGGFEPLAAAIAARQGRRRLAPVAAISEPLASFLSVHGFDPTDLDAAREHGLTPLMRAALAARGDLTGELLRLGADVHARNADGNNALWLACVSNDAAVVVALVGAGIDVDNRNDAGATALMYAASTGKAPLVEVLLARGADPGMRNQDDFTALELASTPECLALLRRASRPLS